MNYAPLLAAACLFPIAALCEDPPPVIQIGRESVKEGRAAAHRKVETDWARSFRRAKFPYHYLALESMTGQSGSGLSARTRPSPPWRKAIN